MKSLSNLIKSNYIYVNHEKTIINAFDTNVGREGQGIHSNVIEDSSAECEKELVPLEVVNVEKLLVDQQAMMEEKLQMMRAEAEAEAARLVEEAEKQAKQIREEAISEGRMEGFQRGYEDGLVEIEQMRRNLEEDKRLQQQEYEATVRELEPQFAKILIQLLEQVTGILAEEQEGVLLHLIQRAIHNSQKSLSYLIRVSEEEFDYVQSQFDMLRGNLSDKVEMEVTQDSSLTKNQCLIETQNQIIDCSLEIQVHNLINSIKLLNAMD